MTIDYSLHYDYIIAGAGCAGLSLAMHLIESGKFSDKKILLVDKDLKKSNDRTWCFWQKGTSLFEPVVSKRWKKLWVHADDLNKQIDLAPYEYKMIRGIDFYEFCLQRIRQQPNIDLLLEKVDQVFSTDGRTGIMVKDQIIRSQYIFNSILFDLPILSPKEYWLLQHFKGWIIETQSETFDPSRAIFMDFRTTQQAGPTFCYVLPLTANSALVEYTLFSPSCLNEEEYNKGLEAYIHDVLQIKSYKILDEEHGVIPMTNFQFPSRKNNIINIGTAGGQTKGSSGYTFNFIQKHCARLVEELIKGERLGSSGTKKRFHFYDSVLLNILYHQTLPGNKIFTDLFRKNKPPGVLKFLDNESGLWEELKIVSSLPPFPFVKAALQQIF